MKIVHKTKKDNCLRLKDLDPGEVFRFENSEDLWMRIGPDGRKTGVDLVATLKNGHWEYFDLDSRVTRVNGAFVEGWTDEG